MLFDHARIDVPKIARNYHQRHTVHHGMARPRVAQAVERDRGLDLGAHDRVSHSAKLMRHFPR